MTSNKPDPRDLILRRRARFMGLALAGMAVLDGCETQAPQVCLSVPMPTTEATPMPCLSPPPEQPLPDAGAPEEDAGSSQATQPDAGEDAGAPPQPCLTMPAPTARPKPCLSVRPPPKKVLPQPCLFMPD
jgi:hypothetical protein